MKKRIVFVNLHASWMLVKNTEVLVFKTSAALKHKYLLDYLLESPDYEVCNYITDRGFSFFSKGDGILDRFFSLFRFWENRFVLKKNGIDSRKVTVLKSPNEIRHNDIVVLYNIMRGNYRGMDKVNAFKALSMLHFHGRKEENDLIAGADIQCYFNEVNLSKSSELYRRYYSVDRPWIIIPFVYAERFKVIKPFKERRNKCFSTGTITYKEHEEFLSVYGEPCDQPARKFVKDNPDFFKDTVDCYSSDYLEDNPGKKYEADDVSLVRVYKRIYNLFHVGKQKKYFSFNMVEKFNDYKMHLVGEEILGVPGIGFVEGMACGSAYIGLDSPMYRDLGLIPGVHYIAYDGTKEGLRATIEYWQKSEHQDELEQIAKTGCDYVRNNFNGQSVSKILLERLERAQDLFMRDKQY